MTHLWGVTSRQDARLGSQIVGSSCSYPVLPLDLLGFVCRMGGRTGWVFLLRRWCVALVK